MNLTFDARPTAPILFKERLLWLLFLAPFFFLTYGVANQLAALHESVPSIRFVWEEHIPFIAEMIVPYMSLDLLFGFSFLLVKTRDEIQRHALRLGLVIALSVVIFILFPLQFTFEKPVIEGWTQPIFAVLAADLPYNQLPSLHVSLSIVVGYVYYRHFTGFWRWLAVVWFVLIVLSTLFVYQHHVIDLPTGLIAGLMVFYWLPVKGNTLFPSYFISPKHLHIAVYYLVFSILFTWLAFKLNVVSHLVTGLSAWIALSFFILSIVYVLAYNPMIRKKRGRIHGWYWLVFWPYLLINRLVWHIWRQKVPTMVAIDTDVWIGRSLAREDHPTLAKHNIKTIIDLAPEINDDPPENCSVVYYPLLDLAIPDPQHLIQLCQMIQTAKQEQQGNVYIHCKFGLSRSVLVGCAWLMTQGYTQQQAWQKVSKMQPKRVKRPYMHIALALFDQYLKK